MEYYASTYVEARDKFIDTVNKNNGQHHKLVINGIYGAEGEELSIDIGVFGSKLPEKILIHSSGVHGVEGFHGSAIQIKSMINIKSLIQDNKCVIFIHCVNPYGMSHLRRWNENNVDLNRNFNKEFICVDSCDYDKMYNIINPSTPDAQKSSMLETEAENLKQIITIGQNKYSKGLFNIGNSLEVSSKKIICWLKENYGYMDTIKEVISIDIHSGLGNFGDYSIIIESSNDVSKPQIGRAWPLNDNFLSMFGDHLQPLPYKIKGFFEHGIKLAFDRNISIIGISQEFGTYSFNKVLQSLIEENYYTHYENIDQTHFSRIQLLETFLPPNEEWKVKALYNGVHVFHNVLSYLQQENTC